LKQVQTYNYRHCLVFLCNMTVSPPKQEKSSISNQRGHQDFVGPSGQKRGLSQLGAALMMGALKPSIHTTNSIDGSAGGSLGDLSRENTSRKVQSNGPHHVQHSHLQHHNSQKLPQGHHSHGQIRSEPKDHEESDHNAASNSKAHSRALAMAEAWPPRNDDTEVCQSHHTGPNSHSSQLAHAARAASPPTYRGNKLWELEQSKPVYFSPHEESSSWCPSYGPTEVIYGINRSQAPSRASSILPASAHLGHASHPPPSSSNPFSSIALKDSEEPCQLDEVWDAVTAVQSDMLDEPNGTATGTSELASAYSVSVVHEVEWRPEQTSAGACFNDLSRHVSRLVRLQEHIVSMQAASAARGRAGIDVIAPNALARIATALVSVLNEAAYAARPKDRAARARYLRADLAADRPFTVFAMFSRLADKLSERAAADLVSRMPMALHEWVAMRNAVVAITERVRCSHEIYL
jgi:hypothetical protein